MDYPVMRAKSTRKKGLARTANRPRVGSALHVSWPTRRFRDRVSTGLAWATNPPYDPTDAWPSRQVFAALRGWIWVAKPEASLVRI